MHRAPGRETEVVPFLARSDRQSAGEKVTSRERVTAALAGREVDSTPVAPYFWGAEYSWKLLGKPLWEVLHGPGDMATAVIDAIDRRHGPDWIIQTHASSGMLVGKERVGEDATCIRFADQATGEQYVFHKEGHWLLPAAAVGTACLDHGAPAAEPPDSRKEADDWLRRHCPYVFREPAPAAAGRALRERFPDRFLCGNVPPPFAGVAYPMGFEPTMVMLHRNPSLCAYMIERLLCHLPECLRGLAAQGCDGIMMVDSWASADIMSPATYANWIAPLHKMVSDQAHAAGLKSIMYNTGNLLPLMPCIASLGFDAISFEERSKGVEMDIADMRRLAGPEICLFGNFDAYLLLAGDRQGIRDQVRRQLAAGGPRAFVMGTGSPVCDATDPAIVDFWFDLLRGREPL